MLVHGVDDPILPVIQSRRMRDALRSAGKTVAPGTAAMMRSSAAIVNAGDSAHARATISVPARNASHSNTPMGPFQKTAPAPAMTE